ncbi:ferrochelatase hem15 [Friedmanniomyces endolithicus]|nr:ferrochelatase hem15 [Friedmanniomyces endolithicus]
MATAMFQKLRLTKQTSQPTRKDSILPSSPVGPPSAASLLGLPPELRNAIYECLARDTTLTLALKPRRSKRPHPICGLLLASKQIYGEFRPLLVASARISIPIADFDFGTVIRAVEAISQDDLRALAANRRFYLTLFMAHAPKQTDLEGLAAWLGYRAEAEQDKDAPPTDQVPLHTLRFRYDAKIDPARSMVSRRNMRVALLTALIRKIAALGGHKNHTVEKRRMMRDLYRCKDELMGVERRADGELEKDIALTASTIDSPFFGFQGSSGVPVGGY